MVPLVTAKAELDLVKERIDGVARAVETEQGLKLSYSVGTMVELPRACINAGEIGKSADFFSFGTNDLTQTRSGSPATMPAAFSANTPRRGSSSTTPSSRSIRRSAS